MGMINLNQDAGGIFLGNNRTNTFLGNTRNDGWMDMDDAKFLM
jgi:hypothetical protein